MTNGNNIGSIVGAGLSIIALGVTAKIAMDLMKTTAKMSKTKGHSDIYKKIWG